MCGVGILCGELRVQPIFGEIRCIDRDVEADPAKAWRADQDQQRRDCLDTRGQVAEAVADQVSTGQSIRNFHDRQLNSGRRWRPSYNPPPKFAQKDA